MNIEQRLEAVERSLCRWRRATISLGILALLALVAAAPELKKVEGNFLSLVSPDKGTQLVGASADEDGGKLFVVTSPGAKGKFSVFNDLATQPLAGLMNNNGQWAIKLQVGPKGEGIITLRDATGVEHPIKP